MALEGEGPAPKKSQETVFISYAREDFQQADRLYKDLKYAGVNPWLDKYKLLPGHNWKIEIRKALNSADYFIPCFSSNSVDKRGYAQAEIKFALDVLDEIPESQIFVIPARLNECNISYEKLREYHYVDLFPIDDDNIWKEGVKQILRAIGVVIPEVDKVKPPPRLSPPFRGEKKIFVDREEHRFGGQTISCQNCNTPKTVYPPSSEYVETKLEACPKGDIKSAFFDCESCNTRNNFSWHKQHGDDRFRPAVS